MYGVGGIPHTQWNGVQETVGGYPNGNWEAFIGQFEGIYNSMVNANTPYEIDINGYASDQVSYDVSISMDSDMSNANQKVDIMINLLMMSRKEKAIACFKKINMIHK